MPTDLTMPALSPTMEKGTLARWLIAEGDRIRPGDPIAEIETDKATMELEAIDEGRVTRLVVREGTEDVPVGAVIAILSFEGEAAPPDPVTMQAREPASPERSAPAPALTKPGPALAPLQIDQAIDATPLARRLAAAQNIALTAIRGSGADGRIVGADVGLRPFAPTAFVPAIALPAPPAANDPAPVLPPAGVPVDTVKLSSMRRTIARRLSESKRSVPHFYLTVRCRLDALLTLRGDLNASLAAREIRLSVNDMLIKAMAMALIEVPEANVQFGGDTLHRFGRVDISVAVAIDGGLVTPVIRDAATLSVAAIAQLSKSLAARARDGKLVPEDYQGGTASISNLGMFGIDEMIPVINVPQALILGVGAGIEQPWKIDDAIGLATIMAATASFDHRAIDGADAARFMAALRDLIETPLRIVS